MTRTIKTELSESPTNQHNIMQSIKQDVKEEHYQDCVVKCELDFDEGEQINRKIKVKVEDVSSGQLVQHFKCVKKEEEDGGEYVMECDCEDCETCRVKMEMKEELDESGDTELGGNSGQAIQGNIRVKKEEEESVDEGQRPKKIRRMDRVVGNGSVVSPSHNVISTNVECPDDQMSTSSTTPTRIEDHTQPSQPVTVPLPTPIVTSTQPSSSSGQLFNETLRDQLLRDDPRIDNVEIVVEVDAEEFDREQIDHGNSTLNPVHIDQDDEEDDTIEQREDLRADDEPQVQVTANNFVKRIETDEQGNRFECDYRECGKRMKRKWDLVLHIRSHTGEMRFKCTVAGCDRAFVQKCYLDVHLNTHTGTRPFVCIWPGCEARFAQKCHLTVHICTHTGERPLKCDQCDATFIHHSNLATHLLTHTGSRPFICTWPNCGQAFARSNILKTHFLVHSNDRSFVCQVTGCTKVYKSKDALRRHQKDKHN